MRRGTVQVNLRVDRQASAENYRINTSVVENYRWQIDALNGRNGWSDSVGLDVLLQLPGAVDEKCVPTSIRAKIGPPSSRCCKKPSLP